MKTTMIMRILAMMSYLEVLHRQMTVKKLVLQVILCSHTWISCLLQRSMPHVQIVVANFFTGIIMFAKKSDFFLF